VADLQGERAVRVGGMKATVRSTTRSRSVISSRVRAWASPLSRS
jgi:hypothetical protein